MNSRLLFLCAALGSALLAACAAPAHHSTSDLPAIVFVHGNGDSAALWHTTFWRFESNGYDRGLLHAIDFTNPLARSDDAVAQENRSSTAQQREELAAKVAEVMRLTGRAKVALVGNSRGGNAIRNYVKNGGAAHVSHVMLGGATNHGVRAGDDVLGNEFNGKGPFLVQLNAGANEVVAGVRFLTLRSDTNDKYAQPDGRFIGRPGKPTNVSYDAPALKGAENIVLPGLDHREVAFHPKAFAEMYRFVTGEQAARLEIAPETEVTLNGKLSGYANRAPSNLPLASAPAEGGSAVSISRPRGYFGHGRDTFTLDGEVPPGINDGVPGVSSGAMIFPEQPQRAIPALFNRERIVARNWPVGHAVIAEFHD